MIFWMSSTAIGSTPAKGSSSRMNRGRVASARAISTRRRSPPDSETAGASAQVRDRQVLEQRVEAGSTARPRRVAAARGSRGRSRATVSLRKIDASCGRYDRPRRARRWIGSRDRSSSSSAMRAAVGGDQADDHVEAGGLAGAVGAEQADDLAARDVERDVVDDGARLVALAQVRRRRACSLRGRARCPASARAAPRPSAAAGARRGLPAGGRVLAPASVGGAGGRPCRLSFAGALPGSSGDPDRGWNTPRTREPGPVDCRAGRAALRP